MRYKLFFFLIFILALNNVEAHEGFFLKFSLGMGYLSENSGLNDTDFAAPSKNHAVGYGINDRLSIIISDFGGLVQMRVGVNNYMNLDAFGPGISYEVLPDMTATIVTGYGQVAFAKKWWEPTGTDIDRGFSINVFLEKEWLLTKHIAVAAGPQVFFIKTENYQFERIDGKESVDEKRKSRKNGRN